MRRVLGIDILRLAKDDLTSIPLHHRPDNNLCDRG
jgi:hypothetical protein